MVFSSVVGIRYSGQRGNELQAGVTHLYFIGLYTPTPRNRLISDAAQTVVLSGNADQ
jgi:hypothetical protein